MKSILTLRALKGYILPIGLSIIIILSLMMVFIPTIINPTYLAIIIVIVTLVLFGLSYRILSEGLEQLSDIHNVTSEAANGILYNRITNINKNTRAGALAWNINDVLDQMEIFTRDMNSSLDAISKGQSHRKMYPSGLKGDFVKYSENINKALESIATAQSKDAFIQDMLKIVEEYKKNDYTNKIDTTGMQEDIIGLANGINQLGKSLADLSLENLHNGLALQKGAKQLADDVHMINDSSQEQVESLKQTTEAINSITSKIQQTSKNTNKMAQYAKEVTDSARSGKNLANETATSMDEINSEVSAINEAIGVIDQIAFQTNILSLNAAVEAATAGEAGKGFAVVAGEVRNLASRSAEAANEIKKLVEKAASKADNGKSIANNMIEGYTQLNNNIDETINLINEVTQYSKEQEGGIININDSITVLNEKAQNSAKIAYEANIIAIQSNDIAQKIVNDAKSKDVVGKEKVHIREKLVDLEYKGPERRKVENKIRKHEPL